MLPPQISVVVASFNGAKYIKLQLESILNQSEKNIKVIVCDDCSTDGTQDIIKTIAEQDSRVVFIQNASNMGFVKNFENALQLCQSKYIALCDQDDIWLPNHLELLHKEIDSKHLQAVAARYTFMSSEGLDYTDTRSLPRPRAELLSLDTQGLLSSVLFNSGIFHGASMMITRELRDIALPFPSDIKFHDLWLSLLALCNNKAALLDTVITRYRVHSNTVTQHGNIDIQQKRSLFSKICNINYNTVKLINPYIDAFLCRSVLQRTMPTRNTKKLLNFTMQFCNNYKKRFKRILLSPYYFCHILPVIARGRGSKFVLRFIVAFFVL